MSRERKQGRSKIHRESFPQDQRVEGVRFLPNIAIAGILMAAITFLVYLPALQNHFVNVGDISYVYENSHIRSIDLSLLKWTFGFHAGNWHPLIWISYALDYSLWGLTPKGYHLTNILVHSFNTFSLFIFAFLLFGAGVQGGSSLSGKCLSLSTVVVAGAVTALLFGIHPVHVESVAWVSGRKDLLSAFFVLISLILYTRYVKDRTLSNRKLLYAGSLCSFVLALMSKPMAVTLPVLLLLLDVYPFQRLSFRGGMSTQRRVLTEKVPFFALTLASSVITLLARFSGGAVTTFEPYPLGGRIATAIKALPFYLLEMFFPVGLSPLYPYPGKLSFLSPEYIISLAVVVLISLFCAWEWKRGWKAPMTVWVAYVVSLLPVLGIIQLGGQAAADRYTYIPSIGPFLLVGLGAAYVLERTKRYSPAMRGLVVFVPVLIIFALLGGLTVKQIGIWKNSSTLWSAAIRAFPGHAPFYNMRASAYEESGDYKKALEDLNTALSLKPDLLETYINLGAYHSKHGDYHSSLAIYTKAIELNPQEEALYNNRALVYLMMRDFPQGVKDLDKALSLNPRNFAARLHKCQVLIFMKKYADAAGECSRAIECGPGDSATPRPKGSYLYGSTEDTTFPLRYDIAYYNRGVAYLSAGEKLKAVGDFDQALRLNHRLQEAYVRRGSVLGELGRFHEAIEDFNSALLLNPKDSEAYYNRGVVYFRAGKKDEALKDFQKAALLGSSMARDFLLSSKETRAAGTTIPAPKQPVQSPSPQTLRDKPVGSGRPPGVIHQGPPPPGTPVPDEKAMMKAKEHFDDFIRKKLDKQPEEKK